MRILYLCKQHAMQTFKVLYADHSEDRPETVSQSNPRDSESRVHCQTPAHQVGVV